MAFAPRKNKCAVIVLTLGLGLTACAPRAASLSATETAVPTATKTSVVTGTSIVTETPVPVEMHVVAETPTPTETPVPTQEITPTPVPTPTPEPEPTPLYSIETEGPAAENLTDRCLAESSRGIQHYLWRITDEVLTSFQDVKAGQWVSLSWGEDVPVRTVWLSFQDYPGAYRIQQFDADGALLQEEPGSGFVNHAVFLEPRTRKVTLLSEGQCSVAAMYAFGEGAVPNYHPWEPTPEKLDYLIVAMHPDDDVLFMGAILPLYTVDQGREGSIFYTATRNRVRKDEAQNGAWIMGLRTAPILGTFRDISPKNRARLKDTFTEDQVTLTLVRLFRQYRPEVIFSHDLNGEYGHWQHALLAKAVKKAVPLAAKESYDARSVKKYGTWQVKKLYLHLYAKNKISLPVEKPIEAYGELTPVQIAIAAFQCHQSQLPSRHAVRNEGVYSLSDFGLAYTVVGLDTPGVNDPFEHIDPTTIHSFKTSGPTPTPEP